MLAAVYCPTQNKNKMIYSEGICNDGTAILKDGLQLKITEILQSLNELETIKQYLKSDSVYTLLRGGVKRPSSTGVDDCEDNHYYDLYNIVTDLRSVANGS